MAGGYTISLPEDDSSYILKTKMEECNEKCMAQNIENIEEEKKEMRFLARKTITIEGMHCNHCKMAVEKVLKKIHGVEFAEVD